MEKNILFITVTVASLFVAPLQAQKKGLESINQHDLKQHMLFLSSDELKGRDTGEPGLEVAARYLAATSSPGSPVSNPFFCACKGATNRLATVTAMKRIFFFMK